MQEISLNFQAPAATPPFRPTQSSQLSTRITTELNQCVSDVIDEAAARLGIELDPHDVEQYGLSRSVAANLGGMALAGTSLVGMHSTFDVFDDHGRLWWGRPFGDITVDQLRVSTQRRITAGNPRIWHILVGPPGGGFDPSDLVEIAKNFAALYAALAAVKDGSETVKWYAERIWAGWQFFEKHQEELASREATLARLEQAAAALDRIDDLAQALGVSPEEAGDLATLWGYEPDDCRWEFTGSQAHTLRMLTDLTWKLPHEALQLGDGSAVRPEDWAERVDAILTGSRQD